MTIISKEQQPIWNGHIGNVKPFISDSNGLRVITEYHPFGGYATTLLVEDPRYEIPIFYGVEEKHSIEGWNKANQQDLGAENV